MLLIDPLILLFLKLITMLGIPYSFVNLLAIIPIIPECQFLSLTKINILLTLISFLYLKAEIFFLLVCMLCFLRFFFSDYYLVKVSAILE